MLCSKEGWKELSRNFDDPSTVYRGFTEIDRLFDLQLVLTGRVIRKRNLLQYPTFGVFRESFILPTTTCEARGQVFEPQLIITSLARGTSVGPKLTITGLVRGTSVGPNVNTTCHAHGLLTCSTWQWPGHVINTEESTDTLLRSSRYTMGKALTSGPHHRQGPGNGSWVPTCGITHDERAASWFSLFLLDSISPGDSLSNETSAPFLSRRHDDEFRGALL
ncbi:hypothetical protein WN48_11251 [Eufriesea mexicana]|uniref:Uncharacterized protein n=1 Tax=Eufriesea mexicana TaxID=516756 RepID=A0A310S5M4_9HYME|nr:hypothetical protein WN48_11251 [Eufriesea mexicana]